MEYHKQTLGIMVLTAFIVTLWIVLFFACFYVLQDAVNYVVTGISARNILTPGN